MARTLKDLVSDARGRIDEISVSELEAAVAAGEDMLLVDVREPAEYQLGHIEGAVAIPRGTIEPAADLGYEKRHPALSAARERRVVLYCASGGRSALAADVLQEMGFTSVASLAGGFTAWKAANLSIAFELSVGAEPV